VSRQTKVSFAPFKTVGVKTFTITLSITVPTHVPVAVRKYFVLTVGATRGLFPVSVELGKEVQAYVTFTLSKPGFNKFSALPIQIFVSRAARTELAISKLFWFVPKLMVVVKVHAELSVTVKAYAPADKPVIFETVEIKPAGPLQAYLYGASPPIVESEMAPLLFPQTVFVIVGVAESAVKTGTTLRAVKTQPVASVIVTA